MWPKLLTDLVFLRSKTQSFPWKNIDSNTHMGCGEGEMGGGGRWKWGKSRILAPPP